MTYRLGSGLALSALLALWLGAAGAARAQSPNPSGTPLPLAVDLKKVPVGSWSEYHMAAGKNSKASMTARMALVARTEGKADLETEVKGGPLAQMGRTILRMSIPIGDASEVKPTEQVLQIGDNPPMLLPASMTGGRSQTFRKLDPKTRIGVDDIKVPGGTFPHADHFREKGPAGETIDYWINKTVMPFGLLKVTSAGSDDSKTVSMELTGHGGGAKPEITKPPQPFDPSVLMRQARPSELGGSNAGPPDGTPLRPIPSPHPGMPATTPPIPQMPAAPQAPKK